MKKQSKKSALHPMRFKGRLVLSKTLNSSLIAEIEAIKPAPYHGPFRTDLSSPRSHYHDALRYAFGMFPVVTAVNPYLRWYQGIDF